MIPNVARYLNKTVMVSIPALFDDRACRSFRLVGAELNGLWLQSDELIRILLPEDRRDLAYRQPVVFGQDDLQPVRQRICLVFDLGDLQFRGGFRRNSKDGRESHGK